MDHRRASMVLDPGFWGSQKALAPVTSPPFSTQSLTSSVTALQEPLNHCKMFKVGGTVGLDMI